MGKIYGEKMQICRSFLEQLEKDVNSASKSALKIRS